MSKEEAAYQRGLKDGEGKAYRTINLRHDATRLALDILGRFTTDPLTAKQVIATAKELEAHWRSGS